MKTKIVIIAAALCICGCSRSDSFKSSSSAMTNQIVKIATPPADKNFQDAINPMRDPKFRLNDIIETIQDDSAAEMKNIAWEDNELNQGKEGSDIVDNANEVLRRRMSQQISTWTNSGDADSNLSPKDIQQINSWENGMEQKVLETVIECEKHGENSSEIEDAVVLTMQLKQQSQ